MFSKIKKRTFLLSFVLVLILAFGIFALANENTEKLKNDATTSSSFSDERKLVGENEQLALYYDEVGADIFVLDKKTNKEWSNSVSQDYYNNPEANQNLQSLLFTLNVADKKGSIDFLQFFDAVKNAMMFEVNPVYIENQLNLEIKMSSHDIAFIIQFKLLEDSISVSIPVEKIVESGDYKVVNFSLMPMFGALRSDEEGYIMYPDGSGALVEMRGIDVQNPQLYSFPIYGNDLQDIAKIEENSQLDIKNVMMPVYGIKGEAGSFMAAMTAGEADSSLNIAPSGFQIDTLNRAYFSFSYMNYAMSVINDKTVVNLVPYEFKQTKEVRYFFFEPENGEYDDMALKYRELLQEQGILPKEKANKNNLSLDFFMGINEKGFWGNKLTVMTKYSDVNHILNELKNAGINDISSNLLAWSGGYDVLPTGYKPVSSFGSASDFMSLIKSENQDIYLSYDFVFANKNTGKFDSKNDVIRNYLGQIVTDSSAVKYLLNPAKVFENAITTAGGKGYFKDANIQLENAGSIVIADYNKDSPTGRQDVVNGYIKGFKTAGKYSKKIGVTGGNQYILPYADLIRDIPDTHSGYFINTKSVPFYQIVVSGLVNYTSVSGNKTYDFQMQKLRWIETGSVPYFILTENNPSELRYTSYNTLFSSQYSEWKDKIVDTVKEFNDSLSDITNNQIVSHSTLENGVVKVGFDNGNMVYINYGRESKETDISGLMVDSMNYLVVESK